MISRTARRSGSTAWRRCFLAAIPGSPRAESVRPTNLPAGRPQLVGRDDELAEVLDLVASGDERLVTITGRGGAGKTSLALLAGMELLDRHPGGVWWVDLMAVGSPDEVALAIAAVVGAERDPEKSVEAAMTTRLRHSGATLVVLDNMEHVLTVAGALCGLLDGLPDLRLLVTSRLPLRVDPERVIALDGLDEQSALELIGRTVQRRGERPKLTGADGDALREIVGLLNGLPLALQLAAARLAVLTPVQLRDRLRESIDVLGEARGDRPVRQRSLRAALDSTLALLDPAPRALFVRMGAFAGPVELEELERVLSGNGVSVLEALAELVDAALVQRLEIGDGTVRFGLAEALRQIASELLDCAPNGWRWRHAHAQRQYELVWAFRSWWVDRKTYLAAHAAEREAAAALRWAGANHDMLEQPIAAAYALVLLDGGRVREGGAITERLIVSPPADAETRWLAFWAHSGYLISIGRFDDARLFADQAYRAAPDAKTRRGTLHLRCPRGTETPTRARRRVDARRRCRAFGRWSSRSRPPSGLAISPHPAHAAAGVASPGGTARRRPAAPAMLGASGSAAFGARRSTSCLAAYSPAVIRLSSSLPEHHADQRSVAALGGPHGPEHQAAAGRVV